MNPPHRPLAAVAAVLLLASGAAHAVIVPSAQIALDTETPISDPVVASGTFAWNNGVGGDTASARAESTYGGDLKAESISTSAAPTSTDLGAGLLEGFGTAAEALWYGEFAVGGSSGTEVPLDMLVEVSADLFIEAGAYGSATVTVTVGAISVADLAAGTDPAGSAFIASASINNFLGADIVADSDLVASGDVGGSGLSTDETACADKSGALDCTVAVSYSSTLGGGVSFTAGENIIVFASLDTVVLSNAFGAGEVSSKAFDTMSVTPGSSFTLVAAPAVPEPSTVLLVAGALAGVAGAARARRRA